LKKFKVFGGMNEENMTELLSRWVMIMGRKELSSQSSLSLVSL